MAARPDYYKALGVGKNATQDEIKKAYRKLAREGVEAVDPAGERFDPTVHEALSTRPQDGAEPGVVLDVVQKGYRMDDTVVRPARVVVSA